MWETIIGWVNEQWVAITSTGALGLIGLKTFVLDKLSLAKKTEEYSALSGTVIAKDQATSAKIEVIYEQNKALLNENKELKASILNLTSVVEKFTSLTVQALSVANVPVQAKEGYYNALLETVAVPKTVLDNLKNTVDLQKLVQDAKTTVNSKITEVLKKEV